MTVLLAAKDLHMSFGHREVLAGVSLTLERGRVVALVGESGSGKSTVAQLLARLLRPTKGHIALDGHDVDTSRRASLTYRQRVQMILQDPFGSLNPVHPIARHVARPLLRHDLASRNNVADRVNELLEQVGLEPAADIAARLPSALSGGQRQRVSIARALAVEPDVIIADEPTSMLDVSLRVGILNLMDRLKRERGVAILLITHDLASARYLADDILVMRNGRIVERGATEDVITDPQHDYTKLLLTCADHDGASAEPRSQPGPSPNQALEAPT